MRSLHTHAQKEFSVKILFFSSYENFGLQITSTLAIAVEFWQWLSKIVKYSNTYVIPPQSQAAHTYSTSFGDKTPTGKEEFRQPDGHPEGLTRFSSIETLTTPPERLRLGRWQGKSNEALSRYRKYRRDRKLMEVLSENPYAQVLRTLEKRPLESYRIHIQSSVKLDQRVYNSPSADQVAGIWIEGNNANVPFEREIVIHEHSGSRHRVQHYYGCYDPLQYPALFPRGESGWHQNIMKKRPQHRNRSSQEDSAMPKFASADDIFKNEQRGNAGTYSF
ncbi:hypothetical protein RHMOL_Rhmol04G0311400 [Rhododendron molle]|uniref:Uncharacterized protein n=1 Tax=Rhododendron molle TaxID=49168 RepID=A0ACC0P7H7_RHOML|nr:hypothetical protein RHMOL_Rhmol04G0311400 [Rhododendron molle]